MSFATFLFTYCMLIMVAAMAIRGWFLVTRGKEETIPNGDTRKTGQLFRAWYFLWMQRKESYYQQFYGHELIKRYYNTIRPIAERYDVKSECFESFVRFFSKPPERMIHELTEAGVLPKLWTDLGPGYDYVFSVEEKQYYYPEWIRKPLAGCLLCFSSVYGSAIYWLVILGAGTELFGWCYGNLLMVVVFWIIFCMSIASVNNLLSKKAE